MLEQTDVIIAGAGLAGLLCLRELSRAHPQWRFIVIEREPVIGGRLRPTLAEEGSWGCGLQAMSSELFDYLAMSLALRDTEAMAKFRPRCQLGVLAAQKINRVQGASLLALDFVKAIGGPAAVRDWPKVLELFAKEGADSLQDHGQAFAQVWSGDRKSPALIVLEHLAHLWGVPELGPASAKTLAVRALQADRGQWIGPWYQLFDGLLEELQLDNRLKLVTSGQIMAAQFEDKIWQLASTAGVFQGKRLVVAQSPWEATAWLPKDLWPSRLLNIASKTKPVSLVSLTELRLSTDVDLPDTLLIPADDIQVQIDSTQICYQATLNFELTVQAPAVVKAVKRLKRARKKLQISCPELRTEGEHIALIPVAWAQTVAPAEQRWLEKIDSGHSQKSQLVFCGDAYGSDLNSERNLLSSVQSAVSAWT